MSPNLGIMDSRSVCFPDRLILEFSFLTFFVRAISASFLLVTFFLVSFLLVFSDSFFSNVVLSPDPLFFICVFLGVRFFKNSFSRILFGTISYFSFSEIIFGVLFHSFWFSRCCLPLFCVAIMLFFLVLTVSIFSSFSKKIFC